MYRQDMVGFVTPADINKMPVRIYLFNLMADLETALASAIHAHFGGDDQAILELLGPIDDVKEIQEQSPSMRSQELDLGVIQQLNLSHLEKILKKTPALHKAIGFNSGSHVDDTHSGLVQLRNSIAHSVRPLLLAHHEMPRLFERIQRAREILDWLSRYAESHRDVHLPLRQSLSEYPTEKGSRE